MKINTGTFLVSSSAMEDDIFQGSIVFISEHNEKGAMGFVVNKIHNRPLNALVEFSKSPAFPLYKGGPVDNEHLFFIHRQPSLIAGGTKITSNIFLGGDFKKAVTLINRNILTERDIKIFIGYCGWNNGELEEEITEGSWLFTDGIENIFEKDSFVP